MDERLDVDGPDMEDKYLLQWETYDEKGDTVSAEYLEGEHSTNDQILELVEQFLTMPEQMRGVSGQLLLSRSFKKAETPGRPWDLVYPR